MACLPQHLLKKQAQGRGQLKQSGKRTSSKQSVSTSEIITQDIIPSTKELHHFFFCLCFSFTFSLFWLRQTHYWRTPARKETRLSLSLSLSQIHHAHVNKSFKTWIGKKRSRSRTQVIPESDDDESRTVAKTKTSWRNTGCCDLERKQQKSTSPRLVGSNAHAPSDTKFLKQILSLPFGFMEGKQPKPWKVRNLSLPPAGRPSVRLYVLQQQLPEKKEATSPLSFAIKIRNSFRNLRRLSSVYYPSFVIAALIVPSIISSLPRTIFPRPSVLAVVGQKKSRERSTAELRGGALS